jgi:hypothetical protein
MLGLGLGLNRSGLLGPPVITGFAYPMETLTASRAGQWAIDGVPVIGETGSTFVVPLLAYGRSITCDNSAPVVVWKPWDIAGVVSVRVADRGVLNAVSPDVVATNNQTVRRWNGLVSAQPADQTVGVNQPIWRATGQSGNPSVEFDGSNDLLSFGTSELAISRNAPTLYAFVGALDNNPTGGTGTHVLFSISTSLNNSANRLAVITRNANSNRFLTVARRLDAASPTVVDGAPSDSDYHVHTAEALYSTGVLNQRIDGIQVGSTSFPDSGNTQDTAPLAGGIGNSGSGVTSFPGHVTCQILANQLLSATNRSRIERFIGLFGGRNIPLV